MFEYKTYIFFFCIFEIGSVVDIAIQQTVSFTDSLQTVTYEVVDTNLSLELAVLIRGLRNTFA